MNSTQMFLINKILNKAVLEKTLSRAEVLYLLGLENDVEIESVFEVARILRQRYFGKKIFLYGFLFFSTWCRNNCSFCFYRASNKLCKRYRKYDYQISEAAFNLAESGVHLVDLTMGEDSFYYGKENGFESLLKLINEVKIGMRLPIMISFGVIPNEVLKTLPKVGADWFACYQETHNRELFRRLRSNQDYDARLQIKYEAFKEGLLIEEGILIGIGESLTDIVDSIETMKNIGAHQVRVMNFIPQKGTPMSHFPSPNKKRELITIAVLRLILPHRLIPASLDVYGVNGLKEKLRAGANVVTSLIPPKLELRGVAQSTLDIAKGYRTVKGIIPILDELELKKANLGDYVSWIEGEKMRIHQYNFKKGYIH